MRISVLFFISFSLFYSQDLFAYKKLTKEDFVSGYSIHDAEFSPDGRYLAVIQETKEGRIVVVRDFSKENQPITGVLKNKVIRPSSIEWANNERIIVELEIPIISNMKLKEMLEENPSFNAIDYDYYVRNISMDVNCDNQVDLLFDSEVNNFLIDDERHVLMSSWASDYYKVIKVDVYTGEQKAVFKGGRKTVAIETDKEGNPEFRLDFYERSRLIKFYAYNKEGDWDFVTEIDVDKADVDGDYYDDLAGILPNGDFVYRVKNKITGFYEIVHYNKNSKEKRVLLALPNEDVHSIIIDSKTGEYIGYRVLRDVIMNVYFDRSRQEFYDKIFSSLGEVRFSFLQSRVSSVRAVLKSSGADHLGRFYIYDYMDKSLSLLGDQHKDLIPENLGIPGVVNYMTRDGQKVRMYVLFPPGYESGKVYPMVVLPHGGPHARDTADFDKFAQFIATRGYIVIQPNFRGSTGYGKAFEEAGYKQWGLRMQDDVSDAVMYMTTSGYADKSKVCIAGISYGGYAALIGAIKTPSLYQCSISINGVTHLRDQIEFDIDSANSNEELIEELIYQQIGHPVSDAGMLDANSPALHADKVAIPLLIFASNKDRIVPFSQAETLVDALGKSKKSFKFFELENVGHNPFVYKNSSLLVYQEVEQFLKTYIGSGLTR